MKQKRRITAWLRVDLAISAGRNKEAEESASESSEWLRNPLRQRGF